MSDGPTFRPDEKTYLTRLIVLFDAFNVVEVMNEKR